MVLPIVRDVFVFVFVSCLGLNKRLWHKESDCGVKCKSGWEKKTKAKLMVNTKTPVPQQPKNKNKMPRFDFDMTNTFKGNERNDDNGIKARAISLEGSYRSIEVAGKRRGAEDLEEMVLSFLFISSRFKGEGGRISYQRKQGLGFGQWCHEKRKGHVRGPIPWELEHKKSAVACFSFFFFFCHARRQTSAKK